MSKTIPQRYTNTRPSAYATGEVIFADDWKAIVEGQHFHHSRSLGFRALGEAFDPVLSTTSGSYVRPAQIERLQWASQFHRLTQNSGNLRYRIWLVIIAEQLDVQLRIRDPGGSNTTLTVSKSGTGFGRVAGAALGFSAGSSPKMFDLQIRQNTGGVGTGKLAHVMVAEEPYIASTFLPTGR